MPTLIERFRALPSPGLEEALVIRAGSWADYKALAPFHYRCGRPATVGRVFVVEEKAPVWGGHLARPATGAVAVLVESWATLNCAMRDVALGDRYAGLSVVEKARRINAEVRCISRVIVDPRWRGLGLAVRLVRHALATATTRYTEAIAAMGNVNPFFERAGMAAWRRGGVGAVYYLKDNAS